MLALYRRLVFATLAFARRVLPVVAACSCSKARRCSAASPSRRYVAARGYFSVLGGTGCGFKIRRLELSDGPELEWWASDSPELSDIRSTGFKVSAERVPAGPRLGEDLVFQLLPGVTWDSVGLLVLWDPAANTAVSSVLVQKLRPGAQQAMEPQPTMLDNCIELGRDADIRLRWTVAADNLTVDFALEATLSENQWISFGPARPEQGVSNREMVRGCGEIARHRRPALLPPARGA